MNNLPKTDFLKTDLPEIKGEKARFAAETLYNFYFELGIKVAPDADAAMEKLTSREEAAAFKAERQKLLKSEPELLSQAKEEYCLTDLNIEGIRALAWERLASMINAMIQMWKQSDKTQ